MTGSAERRDSCKRTDFEAPICLALISEGSWMNGKMLNHGMQGMCVQSEVCLQLGVTVLIRVDGTALGTFPEGLRMLVLGEVKWCKNKPDEAFFPYEVGIKYFPPHY